MRIHKLKNLFVLAVIIALFATGVWSIIGGIKNRKAYYERDDKYVTVSAEVRSTYRFGLGYSVSVCYEYKDSSYGGYYEKAIGLMPDKGDIIEIEIDSVYPLRLRPSSTGTFKILGGIVMIALAICLLFVLKKYWKKEIPLKISPRTRKFIRIVMVALAAWIVANGVEIAVSSFFNARNFDWGLKMSASNVSSEGITLTLERDDPESSEELMYGQDFMLEKRTPIGWKKLTPKNGYVFLAIGYRLKNVDSRSIDMNLGGMFGKLPMGIYRVWKSTTVDEYYRYPEDEREGLKQELYATFVVLW